MHTYANSTDTWKAPESQEPKNNYLQSHHKPHCQNISYLDTIEHKAKRINAHIYSIIYYYLYKFCSTSSALVKYKQLYTSVSYYKFRKVHLLITYSYTSKLEQHHALEHKGEGLEREDSIAILVIVKVVEWSISFVAEVWTNVALHLMKQVQVVNQLMEYIATTALQ